MSAHLRPLLLAADRIYVYWQAAAGPLALRVSDLSGRPPAQSLDGTGWRLLPLPGPAGGIYVADLPPGHILWCELGRLADGVFQPLAAAPPLELPWRGPVPLPGAGAGQVSRS